VRNFAEQFLAKTDRLDVLVLNAGIASSSADRSEDDIEPVFATNHVGHQLLYTLLESRILATGEESGDARVVVAASAKHYSSYGDGVALSRADLNGRYDEESGKAGGQVAYPQSKLANVLFTQEVARRMACKPVFANSVHPGAVSTEIWGNAKKEVEIRSAKDDNTSKMAGLSAVIDYFKESMWTPEEGALTQVYLAAAADIKERDIRGRYFHPQAVETQPCQRHAHNLKLQKALWSFTEELIAGRG
jgi:NAD(P)-dependent dehydrogenase (short-subunit alcohol dehydrogenase family)